MEWCLRRLYQGVVLEETLPGSGAWEDFTRKWCLMRFYQGVVLDETLPGSGA